MANKLEVTLSFNPIMSGLQRFSAAIEERLERVRAFNLRIENGAKATNQLLAQAAAALSGAKIAQTFGAMVRSGVEFNAQLEQARLGIAAVLKQFDTAGKFKNFDDAINASAGAIELLKQKAVESPASFAQLVQAFQGTVGPMTAANIALRDQVNLIVNMSQAIAGLGIRSEQILQETRALITGNINADAAAAKILGITAADVALAKQQGQLYQFLSSKIAAFAEAGARGAKSLETLRSNFGDMWQQRAAAATEGLNDALKRMYERLTELVSSPAFASVMTVLADKLAGLVDKVGEVARALSDLGAGSHVLLSLADSTANWVLVATALLLPFVALRGVWAAMLAMANPLRMAFVFIAGISFADALRDLQMFSRELGILQTVTLANWGRIAAGGLAAASAALLGFEIGRGIGNGLKSWQQGFVTKARSGDEDVLGIVGRAGDIRSEAERAAAQREALALFERISASMREEQARWFTNATAVEIYRQQLFALRTTIDNLTGATAQRTIALNQAADAAGRLAKAEEEAAAWLKGEEATKLRDAVRESVIAQTDAGERVANARAMLAIHERTLAALRAEVEAGRNSATVQQQLLRHAAARAERIAEIAQLEQEIAATTAESAQRSLDAALRRIASQRADLEGNFGMTEAEKWPERKRLLEEEIAAQQRYVDVLQARHDASNDKGARATLSGQISAGLDKESALRDERAQLGPDPSSMGQQLLAMVTTAQSAIGTFAEQTARAFAEVGESIRTSLGSAFASAVLEGGTFAEKARGFAQSVGTAFVNAASQMVADWIYSHVILAGVRSAFHAVGIGEKAAAEAAETGIAAAGAAERIAIGTAETAAQAGNVATQVGVHAAGEATKTGSTLFGTIGRKALWLGETLFHAAQWVLRVGAHLAGEAAATAITLAQKAIRLPVILAETGAYLAKAAISAMSAMASIPYVGPFLAIAAMAAIIAAGAKLLGGFATGGLYEGPGYVSGPGTSTSDSINARLSDGEFVNRASSVEKFGVPFFERLNAGVLDLSTLPGNLAANIERPDYSSSAAAGTAAGGNGVDLRSALQDFAGRVTVINVQSEREAKRIARRSAAAGDVVQIVKDHLPEIMKRGA